MTVIANPTTVPYSGANQNVDLGNNNLAVGVALSQTDIIGSNLDTPPPGANVAIYDLPLADDFATSLGPIIPGTVSGTYDPIPNLDPNGTWNWGGVHRSFVDDGNGSLIDTLDSSPVGDVFYNGGGPDGPFANKGNVRPLTNYPIYTITYQYPSSKSVTIDGELVVTNLRVLNRTTLDANVNTLQVGPAITTDGSGTIALGGLSVSNANTQAMTFGGDQTLLVTSNAYTSQICAGAYGLATNGPLAIGDSEGSNTFIVSVTGLISRYNNTVTSGAGVPYLTTVVNQTSKTAAINATNLTRTDSVGLYRVTYYLEADASFSSSVKVNLIHTDDIGSVTQSSATLTTSSSRASGVFVAYNQSGAAMQYSTTVTRSAGTYTLRLVVEKLTLT